MTYFDNTDFDDRGEQIPQNVQNTLDRVVNDYSEHWKGVIGEWLQNSYDGWCHNRFGRRTIPESEPLNIRIEVDLDARTFRAADNAGGMDEKTFHHNFAGLDTPGEEKQSGDFGGSYGRGSHVISGLGTQMYAETRHNGYHGGLGIQDATKLETDPKVNIDFEGTLVEVSNCDVEELIKLTEINRVTEYIQARFNPLLQHENVTVTYVIDETEHVISPLDFTEFDVLWQTDELTFEHYDTEYTLRDVVIYDATSNDASVPVGGIAMMKSNTHMDRPFMRVQDYKPRQLRHMDKMFGVCDASELCPEHEDNAHNSFTGNIVSSTGLKEILQRLEREHYIGTPTDLEEKEEIVNATLEVVNSQWDYNPFDESNGNDTAFNDGVPNDDSSDDTSTDSDTDPQSDSDTEAPTAKPAVPDDTSSGDENIDNPATADSSDDDTDVDDLVDWADDDTTDTDDTDQTTSTVDTDDTTEDEPATPELTCSTRQRSFKTDEDINIWVFVENPVESETESFTVEASVTHTDTGEEYTLSDMSLHVDPGMGTSGDDSWTVDYTTPGKYTFNATLYETSPSSEDESKDDAKIIDTTHTWFWVGRDAAKDTQAANTVTFLEDIILVRSDDDDFRAELNEGEHGMVLVANTRHPEYKHAVRLDGRTGTKNQKLSLIRWAHESIMTHLLLDEIDEELADVYTTDGEPMKEKLGGFVRENLIEQMAALTAGAHNQV